MFMNHHEPTSLLTIHYVHCPTCHFPAARRWTVSTRWPPTAPWAPSIVACAKSSPSPQASQQIMQ